MDPSSIPGWSLSSSHRPCFGVSFSLSSHLGSLTMVLSLLYLISLWSSARCPSPQTTKELSLPGCFLVHFDFKVRCRVWRMLNSNGDHNRNGPAAPASLLSTIYFPVSLWGVDEQRPPEDHWEQKEAACLIVRLFALVTQSGPTLCNPRAAAHQAPLSTEFSRQEYWSGLPCPPPGDLPDPWIKPASPASPELAGRFFTTEPPGKSVCLVSTLQLEGPKLQGRSKDSLPAPQFLPL